MAGENCSEQTALERAIAFASIKVPDAMEVEFPGSFIGSVSIKGVRLYAKRGWPILAQVLIGKRWITVIRGVDPSIGSNFSITARGIKAKARLAQKKERVQEEK